MNEKLLGALFLTVLLVPGPRERALAADNLKDLLKVVTDSSAPVGDRETALANAQGIAGANKPKAGPLKDALPTLLKDLEAKKFDPHYDRLIGLAFTAMEPFTPFPDLEPIVRPYLDVKTPTKHRMCALRAIQKHGAAGVGRELMAMLDEPSQRKDPEREAFEDQLLLAAMALPGKEAVRVLECIVKKSNQRAVVMASIRAFGELVVRKPVAELDETFATKVLVEQASVTNPDAEIACEAALALVPWGSWAGMAEVAKRAHADKKGGTRLTYATMCQAAHKPGGFNDVPPGADKFGTVPAAKRKEAFAAANAWWESVKATKPDETIFQALKDAGINVPSDTSPSSKAAISALIDGLAVPTRTLRYACLDLLVKRTANIDMARDFKMCVTDVAKNVKVTQEEPPEGYPEGSAHATKLYELQKERAKAWHDWWDKSAGHAVLVDGVWKVS
jgi:hypothetical protein